MKKILVLLFAFLLLSSALICRFIFAAQRKKEEKIVEVKVEKKEENKEETIITEETKEEEIRSEETVNEEGLYKMLDFDRRLILRVGIQDDWVCSIFNLAYARAILDNDYRSDPYDYYDGDGAVWRWAGFEDIALSDPLDKVLQKAYDEIDAGRPTIFYVDGTYAYTTSDDPQPRNSEEHFVLILGYKLSADRNHLKPSDFYGADPSGGYCCGEDSYMPWVTLTDDSPLKVNGEYALYGCSDPKEHVDTCIAYVDTCMWNCDQVNEIMPKYRNDQD